MKITGMQGWGLTIVGLGLALGFWGCEQKPEPSSYGSGSGSTDYSYYGTGDITFLDEVQSNSSVEDTFGELVFQDLEEKEHRLTDLAGGKSLVVVITRGVTNPICPYCATQVARFIGQYDEITAAGGDVVVIYPVEEQKEGSQLEAFLTRSREVLKDPNRPVPFPVLLDVQLKNVNQLGIRQNLSKPATYILDPEGKVRFAYVGESLGDRPSVAAVLAELQKLKGPAPAPAEAVSATGVDRSMERTQPVSFSSVDEVRSEGSITERSARRMGSTERSGG